MNLRNIFGSFFGGRSGALRNKPGGMAWIRGGEETALHGRVVKTIRIGPDKKWEIEPAQRFIATRFDFAITGQAIHPGDKTTCVAVHDRLLEPIPGDLCSDSEVRELYAPKPTAKELA